MAQPVEEELFAGLKSDGCVWAVRDFGRQKINLRFFL